MNALVADACVLVEWVAGEPPTAVGERALEASAACDLIGPPLAWSEPRSAVLKKHRSAELTTAERDRALAALDAFPIVYDAEPAREEVLRLAIEHGLSVHDAFYLEIAVRRGLPLASNDRTLRRAAEAEGIALV